MVYVSKSGKVNEMASSGQSHSLLNDSLDTLEWHQAKVSTVSPESHRNGDVDYSAFSHNGSEDICFGLFPGYVVDLMNDKANWKNRTSGITKMQTIINELPDCSPLYPHLDLILQLATTTLSDSHFKVVQMGLELIACIVARVCDRIRSHLPSLIQSILVRVGSNKYVLKEVGMRVLKELMIAVRPRLVVNEIITFGLRHKTSRVREESLNVISAALLSFPKTEFDLISIVKDIAPSMGDNKSRVRQAALETVALLCSLVNESDLKQIIAMVAGIQRNNPARYCVHNGPSMMDAFHSRLARQGVPQLNAHGLVDHVVTVANTKPPFSKTGSDVSWITCAGGVKAQPNVDQMKSTEYPEPLSQPRQRRPSATNGITSISRPYRSAGKRLPWEVEGEDIVKGHLTLFVSHPKELAPLSTPLTTSPKHPTSPTNTLPTPRKKSYSDIYQAKMGQTSVSQKSSLHHPPTTYALAAVQPPNGLGGLASHRNNLGSLGSPIKSNDRGVPLFTPRHTPCLPSEDQLYTQRSYSPTTSGVALNTSASMSVTWPRSGGGGVLTKATDQISADVSKVTGGVHSGVKTNVSRPLSKPRVRNPLTALKPQPPNRIPPTNRRDSPTQLEKDFLSSANGVADRSHTVWGETSWDEEYYRTIPEDITLLNSSLSSSLSSLCAVRELESARGADSSEVDKLKHIRKEAASRKAQLLSAATSASNSPECSRHSSGEATSRRGSLRTVEDRDLESTMSAPTKKTKPLTHQSQSLISGLNATYNGPATKWHSGGTNPTQNVDLNRTYTPGSWDNTSNGGTYANAYATKKLGTPTVPSKGSSSQSKRDRDQREGTKFISIEGHRENGTGKETQLKRPRKIEPRRGNSPPTKSREAGSLVRERVRRSSMDREGTNMIDMEINSVTSMGDSRSSQPAPLPQSTKRQQTTDEYTTNYKAQSATYPFSKKPPIPPVNENTEPATSAPSERVRKRNKHKKISPPLRRQSESGYSTAGDVTPRTDDYSNYHGSHRNSVSGDFESSYNRGSNGSPDGSLQELQPFSSPDQGLKESIRNIDTDDWNLKCEGLLGIRRVAMYHPEVLLPRLQAVIRAVEKEVKNLRSAVARGAIACMGDLFASMRSSMEKELDSIVKILLHKGAETNTFIREDVEKSLNEMINNLSHSKCLSSLLSGGLKHRNPQVRKTTSKYICMIVESQGPSKFLHSHKDVVDRTLPAIIQLSTDNSPEARYYGKRCLHQLWPLADFDKISSRVLSDSLLVRAKELAESLRTKGLGDPPVESHSAKHHSSTTSSSRHSTGGPVRASMQKVASTQSSYTDGEPPISGRKESFSKKTKRQVSTQESVGGDMPLPDGLLDRLKASNWSERDDGVTELEEFVSTYPRALAPHLHKVFDAFCPRLTDRNSKVNLHALEAFSNIVPLLCDILIPVTSNIVNALVPNLASRNATIHSSAMTALDLLTQCIDPAHLIQPVANSAQFGNARVRPIMINKLAELTMAVHAHKPHLISRQVLPVMWHLVSSKAPSTGDAKTASMALCDALLVTMGPGFMECASHLAIESRKKLDDLICSLESQS